MMAILSYLIAMAIAAAPNNVSTNDTPAPVAYKACPDGAKVPVNVQCLVLSVRDNSQPTIPGFPVPTGNPGTWVTTDDCPSKALAEEREGTVGFMLNVGADGRVADCQITASSGSADLDTATCSNIIRRARFVPASNENGQFVKGTYANRVTWRIPNVGIRVSVPLASQSFPKAAMVKKWTASQFSDKQYPAEAIARKEEGVVYVEQEISENGEVISCSIAPNSGPVSLHSKSCEIARTWAYTPAYDIDGRATKARVRHAFDWQLPKAEMEYLPIDEIDPASWGDDRSAFNIFDKTGNLTLKLSLDADGKLTSCSVSLTGAILEFIATVPDAPTQAQFDEYCLEELGKDIGRERWVAFTDEKGAKQPRVLIVRASLEHVPPAAK